MGLDDVFDAQADYHLGHEWVAEVLDLGPGTADSPVAAGDLVVSVPYLARARRWCRSASATTTTRGTPSSSC